MRRTTIFIISILFLTINAAGQMCSITGKVIDKDFYPIYDARINNTDTILPATTDANGNFKIHIPVGTKSLTISSLSMEEKLINLTANCDYLEIIMLAAGTYDFMSARKVDRLRKKEFSRLPELFREAYNKGIFKMDKPCYEDIFISFKERLKEIHKTRAKMPGT